MTSIQHLYQISRQHIANNVSVTLLHIGGNKTMIASGTNAVMPEMIVELNIGSQKTAEDFFRHNPPTPGEVENAIAMVEDEVMPLRKMLPSHSLLCTTDSSIFGIAQHTLFTESESCITLLRANMEQVFGRLAAIISGRPASQDNLPATTQFAATLLILREIMHHLAFESITIQREQ